MQQFQTGAVRDVGGKGRMDLLPMCALLRISKHMEDTVAPDPETGVPHYPERDWEQGLPMHTMIDSALRHLAKYMDGWTDEDHLCAAATNLLMAMWMEEKRPSMQDIPTRHTEAPSLASDITGGTPISPDSQVQGDALPEPRKKCRYYDRGMCTGTKELDPCEHDGDEEECDYYES